MMTFYDSNGRAVAYTEDNENIYLYNGSPVAYLYGDLVYSFNGRQLGRFENGWIRDKRGGCVFFTENAHGAGPVKPVKHIAPVKSVKHVAPVKSVKHVPSVKAADRSSWSNISGESFFMQ